MTSVNAGHFIARSKTGRAARLVEKFQNQFH